MMIKNQINWQKVKLGDAVDIIDGDRGKNYPGKEEFSNSGYCVFLDAKNVFGAEFNLNDAQFITKEKDQALRKGKLKRNDFVLTTRGTVGNVAHYGKDIKFDNIRINSGMVILRPKNNVIDEKFFNFYLISQEFKNQIEALKSGSAQPQLPIRDLKLFEINLPSLEEQKDIVNILWPIKNKIELNNKISRTLEQMAQAIFKEWFVKFKFTGHEKVKMVDSELGKIPEGWGVKSLDKIANFLNGLALQKYRPSNNRDTLPVIKIREMNNGIDQNTELASSSIDEKYKVKVGDVLFSWSGSLELMRWTEITGALNQHLFKVTSENYPDWFFYYWTQKHLPFFKVIARGKATSMGHIQRHHLSEAQVIVPPSVTITKANEIISPMFKNILELKLENQKLAALRDLLLPKLMSGEVRV